jgi:predicted acylesterase/phospholipase RssA
MKKIDTLFLSGGGINCISILGSLKYLLENSVIEPNFKNMKNIVCVSGSAIIVLALILGISLEATIKLYMDTNYDNIVNYSLFDINNLFENFGIFDNDFVENICRLTLKNKNQPEDLTLKQLYGLTNINCVFKTVNITKNNIIYLSHKTYPDLPVVTAIKMTTCIPIIFKPIVYNGDNFVDGGLSGNFPIEYNRKLKSKNYLGINIKVIGNGEINNILDYIYHIYISPWSPYDNSIKNKNIINIIFNEVGIIFTNHNDKKKENIKNGYNSTLNFFNDYKHDHSMQKMNEGQTN